MATDDSDLHWAAKSEAHMLAMAIEHYGSVGQCHDRIITRASNRILTFRGIDALQGRLLWCPSGYVMYAGGRWSPELTDRRGAMLMRDSVSGSFYCWTPEGLVPAVPQDIGPDHLGWIW